MLDVLPEYAKLTNDRTGYDSLRTPRIKRFHSFSGIAGFKLLSNWEIGVSNIL